ncbi:MAG TPA: PDZ domain-containing protein, partial [Candidatus Hydrogenedentes bacterium]|nr:PDZ domain-containing protein [Candidatus Hydrogenedentota bacterium]
AACLALVVGIGGAAQAVSPILQDLEQAFIRLHEEVRPCVVNIDTKGSVEISGPKMHQFEDLFRYFGLPTPDGEAPNMRRHQIPRQGTGSGFIVDAEGHIVTNNHVVEGADTIVVRLWNGREHDAEIIGQDPDTDVAVIKIDADEDLPVAKLGQSKTLRVGQFAIALGSPRGFEGSLSFGHISALGRELSLPGMRFQNFIQTDAAINLGNSGGPLCNIDGEVVGINVAIVYGANSIGFAIPIDNATEILPELISKGKVTRGYLGVSISDATTFAEGLGLPDEQGAFVKQVQADTPAERAGIEPYDVIRKVDGDAVADASSLIRLISAKSPGSTVNVEIWRNGEVIEKHVTLAEWAGSVEEAKRGKELLGFRVQTLSADLLERMDLPPDTKGALVIEVTPGSAADEAGLVQGDVITEVAQKPVTSRDEFEKLVREHARPGKALLIGLIRVDGESDITVIKVPEDVELE